MKICFIIDKDLNPNSYAFIFPVIINLNNLTSCSINILYDLPNDSYDLIFVDSKFFNKEFNLNNFNSIAKQLQKLKKKCKNLIYCDNEASIFINKEIFNYVDFYLKGRLPKNMRSYKKKLYGQREFTDYYHKKYKVKDEIESYSHIIDDKNISKIILGWNNSICDYSYVSFFKKIIFRVSGKIFFNTKIDIPKKTNLISARIKQRYQRNTINYHRIIYEKFLSNFCDLHRLSRFNYFRELKNSKFSFSPFGWGEICYRDFESFFYKCILIKPDMEHITTWPNLYIKNKTYIPVPWNVSNNDNFIKIFENEKKLVKIGRFGYKNYLKYLNNNKLFTTHFDNILNKISI
jgi:hypothetical protein